MLKSSQLIACIFTVSVSLAQSPRPMTLVDVLNVPQVRDPQLSPDGRQILYVLAESNWKANKRVSHIWKINADGSGLIELTTVPMAKPTRAGRRTARPSLSSPSARRAEANQILSALEWRRRGAPAHQPRRSRIQYHVVAGRLAHLFPGAGSENRAAEGPREIERRRLPVRRRLSAAASLECFGFEPRRNIGSRTAIIR